MKKIILFLAFASAIFSPLSAADFFSTEPAKSTLAFSARLGVNTSNSTIHRPDIIDDMESWGAGFTGGMAVDIMFRDWFAIQPAIFYESRSHRYTYILHQNINSTDGIAIGHTLDYTFNIPVLFSARFNISHNLRWSLDFGPYFTFGIGKHDKGEFMQGETFYRYNDGYYKSRRRTTAGLKMGTGIQFNSHYYFGVHYLAGTTNVYKDYGGRAKAWTFTLGYDF